MKRKYGTSGDDTDLHGGDGRNFIFGLGGDDVIHGLGNDDKIFGGTGDDEIHGDSGADDLRGNAGKDTLIGGAGDDSLTGGGKGDVFLFTNSHGNDEVQDFGEGADKIALKVDGLTFEDLKIVDRDGDAVITWHGGKGEIVLEDVDAQSLHSKDFIFDS